MIKELMLHLKLSEDDKIIVTQLLTPIIENTLEKISKQKNIDAKNIYLKLLNEINLLKKEY